MSEGLIAKRDINYGLSSTQYDVKQRVVVRHIAFQKQPTFGTHYTCNMHLLRASNTIQDNEGHSENIHTFKTTSRG